MLPELLYLCTGRQTYQVDLLMYCFHASLPDSLPPPVCFSPPKKTQCLSVTFNCAGNTGNELNNRIEESNTMREITKLIYFTFYQTLNQEQLKTSSVFDITVIAIILKKVSSFISHIILISKNLISMEYFSALIHIPNAPPISAPFVGMLTFTMPQSDPLGL